ncbi:hypothetical protein HK104_001328 [Borealophlyctis nickersoniae]|nr:hypothetical protein HK104_001328 [Borealophlyctis nickersoniae]
MCFGRSPHHIFANQSRTLQLPRHSLLLALEEEDLAKPVLAKTNSSSLRLSEVLDQRQQTRRDPARQGLEGLDQGLAKIHSSSKRQLSVQQPRHSQEPPREVLDLVFHQRRQTRRDPARQGLEALDQGLAKIHSSNKRPLSAQQPRHSQEPPPEGLDQALAKTHSSNNKPQLLEASVQLLQVEPPLEGLEGSDQALVKTHSSNNKPRLLEASVLQQQVSLDPPREVSEGLDSRHHQDLDKTNNNSKPRPSGASGALGQRQQINLRRKHKVRSLVEGDSGAMPRVDLELGLVPLRNQGLGLLRVPACSANSRVVACSDRVREEECLERNSNLSSIEDRSVLAPQQPQLADAIKHIRASWEPTSPHCQFKHYFYNLVPPYEVNLYQPGPNEDAALYEQAKRDNPDPQCLVPVLAVGFGDIKKRTELQEQQCQAHERKLKELSQQLEAIQRRHYLDTLVKLEEYKRRQAAIVHKTLQLMKQVQVLRLRGYSIRGDEEALKSRLEAMERELQKPSVFRGRVNEIRARVQQLKDAKRLGAAGGVEEEYTVADEDALRLIFEALYGHTKGLAELTRVVEEDKKNVEAMRRKYEEKSHGQ